MQRILRSRALARVSALALGVAVCSASVRPQSVDRAVDALIESYARASGSADAAIEGRIEITAADANRFMGLDLPVQGMTADDVARHLPAITAYLQARVAFAPRATPIMHER